MRIILFGLLVFVSSKALAEYQTDMTTVYDVSSQVPNDTLDRGQMLAALSSGMDGASRAELFAESSDDRPYQLASACGDSTVNVMVWCQVPGESSRQSVAVKYSGVRDAIENFRNTYGPSITTGTQ